jgi:nucleoside-diphosphate-sugar epimerase
LKSISILGCGWLGKPLGAELVRSGYNVAGSTTQEAKFRELTELGIKPYLLKFNPRAEGKDLQFFFQSDILIISIPPRIKSSSPETYLALLEQVLEEAKRGSISNIVYISSTAVYPDRDGIVHEEDAAQDSYLAQAEAIINAQFVTTTIRFGGLVGPGRHPGRFLSGKKDLAGKNHAVNIIHLDDCIDIIKQVIEQEIWDEVFNACADLHPTRKEFYTRASGILGMETPTFVESDSSKSKIVSSEKLKQLLNYTFIHHDPLAIASTALSQNR